MGRGEVAAQESAGLLLRCRCPSGGWPKDSHMSLAWTYDDHRHSRNSSQAIAGCPSPAGFAADAAAGSQGSWSAPALSLSLPLPFLAYELQDLPAASQGDKRGRKQKL